MILTGNIEIEGGLLFGWAAIDIAGFARASGMDTYDSVRTRVNGHPDVYGMFPSVDLAADILTPGEGQIKALALVGANPVISSAGGGPDLEQALNHLEVSFALDLYINETNKHADYVLPVAHFYEREDLPLGPLANMLRPAIWATDAVIEPPDGVRQEWQILNEIARRMGHGGAYPVRPLRWLAKLGYQVKPRQILDIMIRTSEVGDRFGLRRNGISFKKLVRDYSHG
ncbi:MAG: molybdopterin-dependent oxidoreductase [Acidimicrobiia bacterium]|nr:molybdopterin-dependent oxidoreductase [Acidimicrobiia bacterium]